MISSPCKECKKRNQSKDECLEDCPLIQGLQSLAISESSVLSTSADYTDDLRFAVPNHVARSYTASWAL